MLHKRAKKRKAPFGDPKNESQNYELDDKHDSNLNDCITRVSVLISVTSEEVGGSTCHIVSYLQ